MEEVEEVEEIERKREGPSDYQCLDDHEGMEGGLPFTPPVAQLAGGTRQLYTLSADQGREVKICCWRSICFNDTTNPKFSRLAFKRRGFAGGTRGFLFLLWAFSIHFGFGARGRIHLHSS